MRALCSLIVLTSLLSGCQLTGPNPDDPYEPINRRTHAFNQTFDKALLKPVAKAYKAIIPPPVRTAVTNVFCNINLLPTIANDLLQAQGQMALKDAWRLVANSTFGIAGIVDVASGWGLPPHANDLGITFAKWGDLHSPYIVIPFLGPATIRDGMGMMFDYALFTPYPYVNSNYALYSILVVRYVDIRAQLLETDRLIGEALDEYSFIRDAYLQHRNYLITGSQPEIANADSNTGDPLYIDEADESAAPAATPAPADKTLPVTESKT